MRFRILLVVCALAVLALAGLRRVDGQTIASTAAPASKGQFSARPSPTPSLPSAVGETVKAPTLSPTPLAAGWRQHVAHAELGVAAGRQAQSAAPGADRPRSFPLLI